MRANPTGGSVAQGSASFVTSGPQLTINASDHTFINWQSFNIGAGETTTFVQPSASSLVWNRINDPNPSQLLGTLNANGYVVLQNESGFYVGGQAAINTHGLLMTTAPIRAPDLSSGGAWEFDTPPPTAKIVNYGKISIAGGAPAFLIGGDIENHGTISDPGGKIGLYAGRKVLISTSPDGRGLSAEVTLPQGSVDNQGKLIADAGKIELHAQVVNQGGLVQADSVRDVNGTIELVASDSLSLGSGSQIAASGGSQDTSRGGAVVLKSGSQFADQAGSMINISGGAQSGNAGQVEISAPQMGAVRSSIYGHASAGFSGGTLTIDPDNIQLDNAYVNSLNDQISGGLSEINLAADHNIELSALWTLADLDAAATLSLSAGNNVILDNASGLKAGKNWSITLSAGTALPSPLPQETVLQAGQDGIYLNGSSFIQTQDGDIHLKAANEILLGSGGIRTINGGSISVTTEYGDVNTGTSTAGFNFLSTAPYYTPFHVGFGGTINYNVSSLGGISTAAGGNVNISSGGDVTSFLPTGTQPASSMTADAGTGAFGSQPGNVMIQAKGNVYGHYVVVNGTGTIEAGENVGDASKNVALSLVKGSWTLNAGWDSGADGVTPGKGDIYLQEVRNPNGVFNATSRSASGGNHLFDYDPQASVELAAGNGVYLTGVNLPRTSDSINGIFDLPILLPPSLKITAGLGGVTLEDNMTLFPSSYGNLSIQDGGDFNNGNLTGPPTELLMSDSAQTHWFYNNSPIHPFTDKDHGSVPAELNNADPAVINVAGNMENLILQTSKRTEITVGGDMKNCSFSGQNLQEDDVTFIHVAGEINNAGSFNWAYLSQPIPNAPLANLPPDTINNWQTLLSLALDPNRIANLTIPAGTDPSQYAAFASQALLFGNSLQSTFAYDSASKRLTVIGSLPLSVKTALDQPLTVLRYDANGRPVVDANGHFATDMIDWVPASAIDQLYQASQGAPSLTSSGGGYVVGGPGEFDIQADSISLGNSYGIVSLGNGALLGRDYSLLTAYIMSDGASINVNVEGNLDMPSSTIAALGGGSVNVNSAHGSMDLGSQELVDFESRIMRANNLGLGIYTSGGGDVSVTALGDVNIDSSRIGTFNGGNVYVASAQGNVNAGSGGAVSIPINVFTPAYANPQTPFEYVYANGIVAVTLVKTEEVPGSAELPGDITVETPEGDIIASQGGILQEALNGSISSGPTVTLIAGTPGPGGFGSSDSPLYLGNIDMGNSGVIGVNLKVSATGKITGLAISQNNSDITGQTVGNLTVLAGGTANVSAQGAGGASGITIIGIQGVSASGLGSGANLLGQNVSVNGGAAQSTLGTSATATSASQSAAQQSSRDVAQQVASNNPDEDDKKKKKKKQPLLQRVKRVIVILPKES